MSPLSLTVLGSGTAHPDPARGPCGLLVQHDGHAVLVDGGSGTLGRLARIGVDPRALEAGVYSHRHPDHTGDLVPLLFSMRVPPGRTRDYPIHAGEGFADFFAGLEAVYGHWIRPRAGTVRIRELPIDHPAKIEILQGLTLLTAPANHSAGALHLRFEAGPHAVVFSGDTGPSAALVELARGADLLVCECAAAEPFEGHLTAEQVAAIVRDARPREVWLTHLYPDVDPELAVATVSATGVPTRRAADLDRWTP